MLKVKIATDSNSGITQEQAKRLGISVLPMPFFIDGEEYFEGVNLSQATFYQRLEQDCAVSTSQPSPKSVAELWEQLLQEDECEILHIPMSSNLSATCEAAIALSKNYDGRVLVVDNHRISITQKQSVFDALTLVKQGKSAREIKRILEDSKSDCSVYIALNTLKYLKKGGRLTPAAALIGSILKIKPILQLQSEKLDAFQKAPSAKKAKKIMMEALDCDLKMRFSCFAARDELQISVAYTSDRAIAEEFAAQLSEKFPNVPLRFIDPLSLSVACHIGPNALACALQRVIK